MWHSTLGRPQGGQVESSIWPVKIITRGFGGQICPPIGKLSRMPPYGQNNIFLRKLILASQAWK